jgi:hypothetical protein
MVRRIVLAAAVAASAAAFVQSPFRVPAVAAQALCDGASSALEEYVPGVPYADIA